MAKNAESVKAAVEKNSKNPFKRAKRLGVNILEVVEGESVFVELKKHGIFTSAKWPDGIPYFDVVNMVSGEEQRLWIDGGLKGALSEVGGPEKAADDKLQIEILKGKKKSIDIVNESGKSEKVNVNTYDVFLLEH